MCLLFTAFTAVGEYHPRFSALSNGGQKRGGSEQRKAQNFTFFVRVRIKPPSFLS
jgi:hypothetical protein